MSGDKIPIKEILAAPRLIEGAATATTAFIDFFASGPTGIPTLLTSFVAFEQIFGGLDPRSEASYQVQQFFNNGGECAIVYGIVAEPSSPLFVPALTSALTTLSVPANLLVIPATANLAPADAHAVMLAAQTFCTANRAFYIADVPPSTVATDAAAVEAWFAQTGLAAVDSAAVYYPRVTIPDPLQQNLTREVASSGAVAGIYARTDSAQGIWKAPAGTNAAIANATPAVSLTDIANGQLTALGINAIRSFPGHGTVVWGARTAAGSNANNSDYKYVNVRRFATYLEKSISEGLAWVVFEPNNEILWASIRLAVNAFMVQLWYKGAFQGTVPQQAFLVKCDATTTTQSDIGNNLVNIVVGFAPIQPAEFVIIQISCLTAPCS